MKKSLFPIAAISILALSACTKHEVELESKSELASTHEVKPIHITIDLNIKIQIDKELKKAFAKQNEISEEISDDQALDAAEAYLRQLEENNGQPGENQTQNKSASTNDDARNKQEE